MSYLTEHPHYYDWTDAIDKRVTAVKTAETIEEFREKVESLEYMVQLLQWEINRVESRK